MSPKPAVKADEEEYPEVRKLDPEISEVMHLIGAMERLASSMTATRDSLAADEQPPEPGKDDTGDDAPPSQT